MTSNFIKKVKEELELAKRNIEQELQGFATKDSSLKDDWDTKFPKFDGASGGQAMEDEANEVVEYISRLPVEYSLETRLRDINAALMKIKKGAYGKCENCKKTISKTRLRAAPEARFCVQCRK